MNAQGQDTETGASADAPPLVMRAQGLKKSFGGQVVLDGVSMELRQGELVLLRGNNGSGKTTLLNLLTGNLEPDSGAFQILANGTERNFVFPAPWGHELNPYNRYTPERLAWQGIGRTWQEIRLFPAHTLAQNIALAKPGTMARTRSRCWPSGARSSARPPPSRRGPASCSPSSGSPAARTPQPT